MTFVVGMLAINFPVVLPLIAKVTFDGNAATYSWMTVSMGVGALFGALAVAHKSNPTARVVVVSGLAFGAATVIASFAPTIAVFVFLVAFVGAGQITFLATCQSTVQLEAEPSKRGRVMAVYTITILGTTPIGAPHRGVDLRGVRPALRPRHRRHRHPGHHPRLRPHPAPRPAPRLPRRTGEPQSERAAASRVSRLASERPVVR